jgi:hypothetical protein
VRIQPTFSCEARPNEPEFMSYVFSEPPASFVTVYGVPHGGDILFAMHTLDTADPNASPALLDFVHTVGDY